MTAPAGAASNVVLDAAGDRRALHGAVRSLRGSGARVALEGVVTVAALRDLAPDELWVPRHVTAAVTTDRDAAALALALACAAAVDGLDTVAVGVRDAATAAAVGRMGFDRATWG